MIFRKEISDLNIFSLHEIEIESVIFWKRKIKLHEIEISSVIFWKCKIYQSEEGKSMMICLQTYS